MKPFRYTTFNLEQSLQKVERAEEDWKAARRATLGDCSVEDIRDQFLEDCGKLGEKWCLEFLDGLSQAQLNKLRNLMLGVE